MLGIYHRLLKIAAAKNHQKFCASAHSAVGMLQAMMSDNSVVRLRPSLSVMTPPSSTQKACITMPRLTSSPMRPSSIPSAYIYSDTNGRYKKYGMPYNGSVHTQARGLPRSASSAPSSGMRSPQ